MNARIAPLAYILRLNTVLFRNCLDGLTDEQARVRPSAATNNAAFVATHLADSRFFILRILGAEQPNRLAHYLAWAQGISELCEYPPLAEIHIAWTETAHALRDRLDQLVDSDLDGPAPDQFPLGGQSIIGALTFLVQHETYHVGQLALLRKHAGLPAMRYPAASA